MVSPNSIATRPRGLPSEPWGLVEDPTCRSGTPDAVPPAARSKSKFLSPNCYELITHLPIAKSKLLFPSCPLMTFSLDTAPLGRGILLSTLN